MPRIRLNDFPDFTSEAGQLEKLMRAIPKIAGTMAVNFYKDSWDKKGFVDKKRNRWKPVLDRRTGKTKKRPLVESGRLRRSIRYRVVGKRVIIYTDVPYAKIHNEGGTISGTFKVKEHERKTKKGKVKVKGHSRTVKIKIPKRQFMGHSHLFDRRLEMRITHAMDKIFS